MTATRKQMAEAFVHGTRVPAHRTVKVDPTWQRRYDLHGNTIARITGACSIAFDWCGWYTPTTAAHMNEILKAAGSNMRVSYAQARDSGATTFTAQVQA